MRQLRMIYYTRGSYGANKILSRSQNGESATRVSNVRICGHRHGESESKESRLELHIRQRRPNETMKEREEDGGDNDHSTAFYMEVFGHRPDEWTCAALLDLGVLT